MSVPLKVLIVEDSEDDAALLLRQLKRGGYEPAWERVDTAEAMRSALQEGTWDVVIADYSMPRFSAPAALKLLKEFGLDIPLIVVSGTVGEDVAVATMRAGAHDYLLKDSLTRLAPAVERELREVEVRKARKQAEEDLVLRVEELARSNAELEQFAYVASHDLQEPLRIITTHCDLLRIRCEGRLDAEADDYINFVVHAATRMRALVKDLLTYSRVAVSENGTRLERIDCERVLNDALANLSASISEKAAIVTHDPLPTVTADPVQMEQLFQNLIGNAIKFHGDVPPEVHVGARKKRSDWLFSVADNGIGIDRQYEDKIFAVFQRLHKQGRYPGTGVGLAICKKIVERHGGRIWFESEPGNGSTFYFSLPAERRQSL